ncbi:MAG: mycofactocin precursor [Desulfobacterales bacterium]|nr:MAG: mycofactocin precursor [Desulfobacterales bacterium]
MKENNEDAKKCQKECQDGQQEDDLKEDIFSAEEIVIEELAIDGICGVY